MSDQVRVVKEGVLKKRSARLHQWSSRYFILTNRTLSYKIKQDSQALKDSFDLVPGCLVTHIESETRASIKGRKLYSFWVVWPHDKSKMKDDDHKGTADSDDEKDNVKDAGSSGGDDGDCKKNLKSIVESEVFSQMKQKNIVEEQIEMHHQRDHNLTMAARVAAVTVGGVVVGALTAGVGLIPYFAVVGAATVAGGGTVLYNWRKPLDSRLIIACDTMEEAIDWRSAIEQQIAHIESAKKYNLPASLDPKVISNLLQRAAQCTLWHRVGVIEGMRVLESVVPRVMTEKEKRALQRKLFSKTNFKHRTTPSSLPPNCSMLREMREVESPFHDANVSNFQSRCRRAQISVPNTPINTFLSLMTEYTLPGFCNVRTVHKLDDHADAIEIEIDFGALLGQKRGVHLRKLYFNRFWSLDDDGVYLITFSAPSTSTTSADGTPHTTPGVITVPAPSGNGTIEYHPVQLDRKKRVYQRCAAPTAHAVITIAPRADFADYEFDVLDCTVSCSCQVSDEGNKSRWTDEEASVFMDLFLRINCLELKHNMAAHKFGFSATGNRIAQSSASSSLSNAASLSGTAAMWLNNELAVATEAGELSDVGGDADPLRNRSVSKNLPPAASPGISSPPQMRRAATLGAVPSGYPQQPQQRSHNRGVTTVQPGMEDMQVNSNLFALDDGHGSLPSSSAQHPEKEKHSRARRMLGLFSRNKSSMEPGLDHSSSSSVPVSVSPSQPLGKSLARKESGYRGFSPGKRSVPSSDNSSLEHYSSPEQLTLPIALASSTTLGGTLHSSGAQTGGNSSNVSSAPSSEPNASRRDKYMTREEKRLKEKDFNIKLKKLRVKIEEKMCEVKRVTEKLREANKQGIVLTTVNNNNSANGNINGSSNAASSADSETKTTTSGITPAQYALLQGQQGDLSVELQRLKNEYVAFAGMSYEDSKQRRRAFARFRGLRSKPASLPPHQVESGRGELSWDEEFSQSAMFTEGITASPSRLPASFTVYSEAGAAVLPASATAISLAPAHWLQPRTEKEVSLVPTVLRLLSSVRFWKHVVASALDELHWGDSPQRQLRPSGRAALIARNLTTVLQTAFAVVVMVAGLFAIQLLQQWRLYVVTLVPVLWRPASF